MTNKQTVTVQINSAYAFKLLQDLQKAKAVTIIETVENTNPVPEWQQKIVLQRIENARKDPSLMLDWDEIADTL